MNQLFFGDNLDILRQHIKDDSIDLVYLDPPFKSDQDYNVLLREQDGTRSAAQVRAFEDTWRWDQAAAAAQLAINRSRFSELEQEPLACGGKGERLHSRLHNWLPYRRPRPGLGHDVDWAFVN